jgi:hypothetical protein
MASLQLDCPLPLHPYPQTTAKDGHKRKNRLSGYILILQDDYRKVTFLNCLTGHPRIMGIMPLRLVGANDGYRQETSRRHRADSVKPIQCVLGRVRRSLQPD